MWDKRKKPKPIDEERRQEAQRAHKRNRVKKHRNHKKRQRDKQFERELKPDMPMRWHQDREERKATGTSGSRGHHTYQKRQEKYEGDMALREMKARMELERKKQRVAPAFNKGGYQYITDDADPSDLGRKK